MPQIMKVCKLSDIAEVQTGPFGSQLHSEDYVEEGTPIVTVEHLGNRRFTIQNLPFVSNEDRERLSKYSLREGDIVFSRVGAVDRCSYVTSDENGWLFSGRCLRVRCHHECDALYLYYYFCSDSVKEYVRSKAVGATMLSLNTDLMLEIPIQFPQIKLQKEIAKTLSFLDSKIELNRQINDNLEAMAKQLYDYWFVQFDFPNEEGKPYKSSGGAMVWNEKLKRKIPNGWTVETVGTYANCKSGYAIKSSDFKAKGIPVIKIGNIQEDYTLNMNGCQYIENNTNKLFYVYQNDVVIAMTGATIGKFAIVPFSETGYFVNQRVGKFELGNNPIKKMPYLINSLKIDYFRNQIFQLASGCAQPNISAEQINNILLLYPSTKILSEYNMKCKWMYEQIANCRYQIDVLTKLRDKLLPLLMNGQATVNYHLS